MPPCHSGHPSKAECVTYALAVAVAVAAAVAAAVARPPGCLLCRRFGRHARFRLARARLLGDVHLVRNLLEHAVRHRQQHLRDADDGQDVAKMWPRCGQDVMEMWPRCDGDVVKMWPRRGQDVVKMWPGCGQDVHRFLPCPADLSQQEQPTLANKIILVIVI
eukprot:1188243-Prorocentrum_minimum.AAC.2